MNDDQRHHRRRREDVLADTVQHLADVALKLDDLKDAEQELRELEELRAAELAKLRRQGSQNFLRWRRRATAAFVLLFVAVTAQGYGVVHNGRLSRGELAEAGVRVAVAGCDRDNETRRGIRRFVARAAPKRAAQARQDFPIRPCIGEVRPLLHRLAPAARRQVLAQISEDRAARARLRAR